MGLNLFAYCLNNPVIHSDKSGESPDTYAGIAGDAIARFLYELITDKPHPSRQTEQLECQIIEKQNQIVGDAASAMWDACQRGYEMQQEAQRGNAEMTIDCFSTPENRETTMTLIALEVGFIAACASGNPVAIFTSGVPFYFALKHLILEEQGVNNEVSKPN